MPDTKSKQKANTSAEILPPLPIKEEKDQPDIISELVAATIKIFVRAECLEKSHGEYWKMPEWFLSTVKKLDMQRQYGNAEHLITLSAGFDLSGPHGLEITRTFRQIVALDKRETHTFLEALSAKEIYLESSRKIAQIVADEKTRRMINDWSGVVLEKIGKINALDPSVPNNHKIAHEAINGV